MCTRALDMHLTRPQSDHRVSSRAAGRRWLAAVPLVGVVCVISAYFEAKKELAKEPPPFKELPGGRIMLPDGSIVNRKQPP